MRTLAIGDIHGCLAALMTLERELGFAAEDRIVLLGDFIDRGPDSRGVLDWIIDRSQKFEVIPIRGNHEIMIMSSRSDSTMYRSWLSYGGEETLQSYGIEDFHDPWQEAIPDDHWALLESTRPYFETDTHIFVHAGAETHLDMDQQTEYALFWKSFEFIQSHQSGKWIICGHSSQKSGKIALAGRAVCMDTWACGAGWLTCFNVDSRQYWQANQNADLRDGVLPQL